MIYYAKKIQCNVKGFLVTRLIFTSITMLLSLSVFAQEKYGDVCGTVVAVPTGNHITIEDANRKKASVRLAWVFAPESPQTNGLAAKIKLDKLVFNRAACVTVLNNYGKDKDGSSRYYGIVNVKDVGDVGLEMLKIGYSWHYTPYAQKGQRANEFAQYAVAERNAREQKLGIWSDPNIMSPWVFQGKSINRFN